MKKPKLGFTVFLIVFLLLSQLAIFQNIPDVKAQTSGITLIQGPLNPPIVKSDNSSYALMANGLLVNQTYQAYFKNNSKTSKAVRFQNKGYSFEMDISTSQLHWYNSTYDAIIGMIQEMNPQNTQINSSRNMVTYNGAWINTDLQYQAYSDQLKETLIIHNVSPSSSSIKPDYLQYVANCYFNNSLTIYANSVGYLHPTNQKFVTSGTVNFNDAQNNTVYWLPNPSVYDSVGNQTLGVYAVTANNGILIVNIRILKTFIDSAIFPVYFDPILRVQGNARGTSTSNSISVTMSSTPTSGNILVAVIGTRGSSFITVSSISQTGVTWTYQISKTWSHFAYRVVSEIWFGVVGSGASTSITINLSGTASGATANICEYSGVATSNFLDKTATNGGTSGSLDTGTTATTTQASELWIGSTAGDTGGLSYGQTTPTNGFTLLDGAVSNGLSLGYLEKIVSSTGAANSGTSCQRNCEWAGCIATFFAASAGDTTSPTYSSITANSTVWATACNFSIIINDETALHPNGQHIFGCNNTGLWANETATNFTATPQEVNYVKTLNSTNSNATHPEIIQFEWWFTDNAGNMNNTGLQNLTLYWALSVGWNNITTFSFDAGFTLAGVNASLNYDNIDWDSIVCQNSSTTEQYVFVNGMSVNPTVSIYQTTGIILIFCNAAGNWTHTYPLQGGDYGSDPPPIIPEASFLGLAIILLSSSSYILYKKLKKR